MAEKQIDNIEKNEIKKAQREEKKEEEEIVEKTLEKVKNKSETPKQAEKKVAEKITKAEDKLEKEIKSIKKNATVNGKDLRISTKQAIAICNFIRNKNIDSAILSLIEVEKMKKPIPMRGEIPHKKGIMSGRYPVKAVKEFIGLLKSLKSNALANELELEKYRIFCKANVASRPYRRFGRTKFKRSHVQIKLIPIIKRKVKEGKK